MEYSTNLDDVFAMYDDVGDGKVELAHVGSMLRALGMNPTEDYLKKLLTQLDFPLNSRISIPEFQPMIQDCKKHQVEI